MNRIKVHDLIAEREAIDATLKSVSKLRRRRHVLNDLIGLYGDEHVASNGHVEYEWACPRKNCERAFATEVGLNRHLARGH